MNWRPACWNPRLRALGAGVTIWAALAQPGCSAGPAPLVTPPVELPPVARNLLNADDRLAPHARAGESGGPARPIARTMMRRMLMSAAFSPDSQRLFAVSSHGELVAYDVASGALRGYARPWYDRSYPSLQVDASGSRVLVAAPGRSFLWDLHTDRLESLPSLGRGERSAPVALHPDGQRIARLSETEGTLELVVSSLSGGEALRFVVSSEASDLEVSALHFSPSGARLAMVSDVGQSFTLLDTSDLSVVQAARLSPEEYSGDEDDYADAAHGFQVAFHPRGGQLARLRPERLELLDSLSGRVRADVRIIGGERRLLYSADGVWLVAASSEEAVVIESETGRVSARVPLGLEAFDEDQAPSLRSVLPRDGGVLFGTPSGEVVYYSVLGERGEGPAGTPTSEDEVPIAYSPDGAWALRPGDPPYFTRYGEAAAHSEFVSGSSQVSVWGVDFSVDGRVLYTHSRSGASRFAGDGMRDLRCGSELPTLRSHEGQLVQEAGEICFFEQDRATSRDELSTLDGRTTLRLDGGELLVTREGAARPTRLVRGRSSRVTCSDAACLRHARLSPDGSAVAFFDAVRTGSERTTWWEVYDTRSGRMRASGSRDSGYHALTMLAAGAFVVHGESLATLYDARGRQRVELERASRVVVPPAADLVGVVTADGLVHVLDVARGRERASWPAGAELLTLGITPDGQRLVGLAADGRVLVASTDEGVRQTLASESERPAVNFAGTYLLTCVGAQAVRYDLRTGERLDVAPCDGRPDAISEDGAYAVITVGSASRVHRLADGRVMTLETLVGEPPSLQLAYDDTGRWDASHLDPARLRIRAAGPGESAPLESPESAARTEGLVGLFLTGQ